MKASAIAALATALCCYAQPAGTQIPLDTFPISSAISQDGKHLLVLHAGEKPPSIAVIETASMKEKQRVPVADGWLGLTFSPDQKFVYVGGAARNTVFEFAWTATGELKPTRELGSTAGSQLATPDFIGDVAVSPDGRLIYAADLFRDAIVVINPQSGRAIERFRTGRRPYRILFHPDGRSFFVTSWAEGAVYQHETANGAEIGRVRLGPQTTDMVLSDRKVPDDESGSRYRLFVTAAGTNNVFVVGVNPAKEMRTLEALNIGIVPAQPAGMTPSALSMSADQTVLYVACSNANAVAAVDISEPRSRVAGFVPVGAYPTAVRELADDRLVVLNGRASSMSVIGPLNADSLSVLTRRATVLSPYRASMVDEQPAARSLFEHVVYIFADAQSGAPRNRAKLSQEFVRFTNYKVRGGSLPEAHLWSVAGIAPAFTERLMPARTAGRLRFTNFAGGEPTNLPPAGYLWSNARTAGLAVRNYGEFVENGRATDPSLAPLTNLNFKGADSDKAKVFLDDLKQFETSNTMPRLTLLRLDGDDTALGAIVEALTKSKFWPKTVVFIATLSGTAPDGLLAISPYTRRAATDNTAYDQTSVLRTIELILGLRPMTMFDASAKPLTPAFGNTADPTPFTPEATRP